jgi:predicted nucleic acid-binding protein
MDVETINAWKQRFCEDRRCTLVRLGRRYTESRDPDDNIMLATALAGRADYLITNDKDLLDLPESFQRKLPFAIVTPAGFLKGFEES